MFSALVFIAKQGGKFQTTVFIKIFTSRLTVKNEEGNKIGSKRQDLFINTFNLFQVETIIY